MRVGRRHRGGLWDVPISRRGKRLFERLGDPGDQLDLVREQSSGSYAPDTELNMLGNVVDSEIMVQIARNTVTDGPPIPIPFASTSIYNAPFYEVTRNQFMSPCTPSEHGFGVIGGEVNMFVLLNVLEKSD
jgi:hypothetical protein